MTHLEHYMKKYKYQSIEEFNTAQEDFDGFCPEDVGVSDCCIREDKNCKACWNREYSEQRTS